MSPHLSGPQLSEFLIDPSNPEQRAHLANCVTCSKELADLKETLVLFRGSARSWSTGQMSADFEAPRGLNREPLIARSLIFVSMLLVAIAGVRFTQSHRSSVPPSGIAVAVSDAALLDEIRVDISRPVPSRLVPLLVPFETISAGSAKRGNLRSGGTGAR